MERLRSGDDGVHVFEHRSPPRTNIVGVARNRTLGAYAETIEDVDRLYVIEDVLLPGRLEALTGQWSAQPGVRGLAEANAEYNRFMSGKSRTDEACARRGRCECVPVHRGARLLLERRQPLKKLYVAVSRDAGSGS